MTMPQPPSPVLHLLQSSAARRRASSDDAPPQSHRAGKTADCTWLFAIRRDRAMQPVGIAWVARSEWG